jgi:hypothetical protein
MSLLFNRKHLGKSGAAGGVAAFGDLAKVTKLETGEQIYDRLQLKICRKFPAIFPDSTNIREVFSHLADGGRYAENFGLSNLLGAICKNFLAN